MLDVPAGTDVLEPVANEGSPRPSRGSPWASLCAPIPVGIGDMAELVCIGIARDHLGRWRRCAWHLVLHRQASGGRGGGDWTHLYRVLHEHGRPLALLDQARPGDARVALRHHALHSTGRRA